MVDEEAEGELVHENTGEAKQAWEKKFGTLHFLNILTSVSRSFS